MRRALAALLIASGTLLGWTAAAVDAATVADAGWWDRNADALLPQIDPPPEGALRVANDPAGTAALAAIRFQLDQGEQDPTLVLRVVGEPVPEGAALMACPATSEWTGAAGAPLSEAPAFDCEAGTALGLVAPDGTAVAFDLGQMDAAPVVDVVISPAPAGESPVTDTFTVDFEVPGPSDIATAGPAPAGPSVPTASPPGGGGGATPSVGGGGDATPSFTPSSSTGGFSPPPAPSVTVPAAGAPSATTPALSPPTTTAIGSEQAASAPLDATSDSGKRWIGLVTAAAIIGLGAYLWRADRARAVMTAGPVIGGLGPFVRERAAPAPDVA